MSFQRLIIETDETADSFKSVCDLSPKGLPAIQNFENFVGATLGGLQSAKYSFQVGAVKATGTITQTSTGAANNETVVICGVTFTAKTSGATGNEWNRSNTVATSATNLAAAINASSDLSGIVTATSALGVVTLTAVCPGKMGNGLALSAGTASNTTISAFANGSDGTSYVIDLL